jgi:hypothetical protein
MNVVEKTLYVSLVAQILALLISISTLFFPVSSLDVMLKDVMNMEIVVQIVEAIFYIWFSVVFVAGVDFASYRYFDWVITTPTMLVSTIAYFEYVARKDLGMSRGYGLRQFWNENKENIVKIVAYNFMMLLVGYLNEIGLMDIYSSTIIGFGFFGLVFHLMYTRYARQNPKNMGLFYFMFIVWGLYGVAAIYPNAIKNTSYNLLDIVSKNFYGVYLAKEIYNLRSMV